MDDSNAQKIYDMDPLSHTSNPVASMSLDIIISTISFIEHTTDKMTG